MWAGVGFVSIHSRADNLIRHFKIQHYRKQQIWFCKEILNSLDVGSYQPDTMGVMQ